MKQVKWNKKRKWLDTRYCKPFMRRLAVRRMLAAQVAAAAKHNIQAISSHLATSELDRIKKSIAIAKTLIGAVDSINQVWERTK